MPSVNFKALPATQNSSICVSFVNCLLYLGDRLLGKVESILALAWQPAVAPRELIWGNTFSIVVTLAELFRLVMICGLDSFSKHSIPLRCLFLCHCIIFEQNCDSVKCGGEVIVPP